MGELQVCPASQVCFRGLRRSLYNHFPLTRWCCYMSKIRKTSASTYNETHTSDYELLLVESKSCLLATECVPAPKDKLLRSSSITHDIYRHMLAKIESTHSAQVNRHKSLSIPGFHAMSFLRCQGFILIINYSNNLRSHHGLNLCTSTLYLFIKVFKKKTLFVCRLLLNVQARPHRIK